jgi:hypothetical protein
MKIWVTTVEHKHGTNVSAFTTEELARADLAAFAREWWNDTGLDDEPPTDDNEAIEDYFDAVSDEFYSLESTELIEK